MFQRKSAKSFVEVGEDQSGFIVKSINKFIGKGVFASRSFTKGDFLLEYAGDFISYKEGERREKTYPLKLGSYIYFLDWNGKTYCIDATVTNRICKYVNDGIGPTQNCLMKLEVFEGRPHLCLYAVKNIAVGDELRYDYGVPGLPWRIKAKTKITKNFCDRKGLIIEKNVGQSSTKDLKSFTRSTSGARIQLRNRIRQQTVKGNNKSSSSKFRNVQISFKESSKHREKKYIKPAGIIKSKGEVKQHEVKVAPKSIHKKKTLTPVSSKNHYISDNNIHDIVTEPSIQMEKKKPPGTSCLPLCFVKLQRLSLRMIRNQGYGTVLKKTGSETPLQHHEVQQADVSIDSEENHIQVSEFPNNVNIVTTEPLNVPDRSSVPAAIQFDVADRCLEQTEEQAEKDISEAHKSNTKSNVFKRKSEGVRKKTKPYRPCLFCGLKQSKLTRHLKTKHRNESRIQTVLRLPKTLQNEEFDQIKKEGILNANKDIMKNADLGSKKITEHLMRERRQGNVSLAACSTCNGFYGANTIYKHKRNCVGAEASTKGPVSIPVSLIADTGNVSYRDEILSKFRRDDVGNLCRTDNFIKLLGFQTFLKIKSREEKKFELRDSIMCEMRRFANLFLEFKSLADRDKVKIASSIDMLARDNFRYLQEAIMNVTTKEDGSLKSGLKAGIGFLLKKAAKVLKGQYLIQKADEKAREVDNFLTVLQHFWTEIFSDAQYANVKARQTDLRKPKHLPDEGDIVKLREFITEEQKRLFDQYVMITKTEYKCLRDIMVCRLTLFNARRGGEPSRLLLKEWRDAEEGVWIADSAVQKINDPIEKYMLGQYKIAYQSGKNFNQMVPFLIPKDCLKGLQILASEETRLSAGVYSKNIFLFPSTRSSEHHIKGWNAVVNVCKRAGIKSRITATSVRHRAATLYAALDVPDKERELFYKHMGHSEEINKHVYQCPLAVQEVTKVGKFFENLDRPLSSSVGTFNSGEANTEQMGHGTVCKGDREGVDTDDSDDHGDDDDNDYGGLDDDAAADDAAAAAAADDDDDDDDDDDTDSDFSGEDDVSSNDEISFKCDRKRATKKYTKGKRTSWPDEDTRKVREFFSEVVNDTSTFDRKGALPGKASIVEFLTQNPRILGNINMERKVLLMRTKLFNERNKSRESVSKHLSPMLK